MATKDFKVKHGLQVKKSLLVDSNISFAGQIIAVDNGTEVPVISAEGKYLQFDQDLTEALLNITTNDIAEGDSNLYYTLSRVDSDINSIVDSAYIVARVEISAEQATEYSGKIQLNSFNFIADSGQTLFSGYDIDSNLLTFDASNIQVFINGFKVLSGNDFTASADSDVITLTSPALQGDQVSIVSTTASVRDQIYLLDPQYNSYRYIADSGQLVFSGSDVDGNILSIGEDNHIVFLNGFRIDNRDYVSGVDSNAIILLNGALQDDELIITTVTNSFVTVSIDSAVQSAIVTNLENIDDYIIPAIDSIANTLIDSNYIQSRQIRYLDSSLTTGLIDSAYINARVFIPEAGLDSADVISIVDSAIANTVDSAYINARVFIPEAGLDSADVTNIIDSAYINARIIIPEAGLDSAGVIGIVDSDYINNLTGAIYTGKTYYSSYLYVADSGQNVFGDTTDQFGNQLSLDENNYTVFVNGFKVLENNDFTADVPNSTITLLGTVYSGDQVLISTINSQTAPELKIIDPYYSTYRFVAESGQAIFSGLDVDSNTLSVDSDNFIVYVNGLKINSVDYNVNPDINQIILAEGLSSNDEVVVVSIQNNYATTTIDSAVQSRIASNLSTIDQTVISVVDSIARNIIDSDFVQARLQFNLAEGAIDYFRFVAESNQSVFSGLDADSNLLAYEPGNLLLYYNGVLVVPGTDFTATDGNSVTLLEPAFLQDELFFVAYSQQFTANIDTDFITGTIDSDYINNIVDLPAWSEVDSSSINVNVNQKLIVDTSASSVNIVLPSSASFGDEIRIIDGTGNASTNNITISRNGLKILGADSDLIINIDRAAFGLVYYNDSNGWLLAEK